MTEGSAAIAVIGMACRFPGAADVDELWRNLVGGIDSITRFSPEQLLAAGVARQLVGHARYVAARGVVADVDQFDAEAFGIHRAEAARIDPQHRLFLEQASQALDDAALDPLRFPGWIGVFGGCDASGYATGGGDEDIVARMLGAEKDFLCTRVSHALRLRGPSITIQTACSTSLVATHLACQSLLAYECDAALAGGVTVQLPQITGYLYQEDHILSRDGRCRPFDADASGTVSSSGVAVVVLKRLGDALRDGDRIDAVLLGSAINNDGGDKLGYTAPSVTGQRDAIRLALANAAVTADTIGYVEAHGTATRLGDPVEIAALTAAFRESTDRRGYCRIGSIKSNLGHTGAVAGSAGLIKTVCMLRHAQLVPSLHYRRPNPEIAFDASPFVVSTEAAPWRTEHGPLRAGVSSFGMGGTNAHVVLEASPDRPRTAERRGAARLFPISARSPAALAGTGAALAAWLERHPATRLDDAAATLATGRRQLAWRRAVVHGDPAGAIAALREGQAATRAADPPRGVAFVFPGQGAVRVNAGRRLYETHARFRATVDEARAVTRPLLGIDLKDVLYPDAATDEAERRLRETDLQQVALFTLCWAMVRQLDAWGVRPGALLGHSLGEYVAATAAGVWSPEDALRLVCTRGRLMQRTDEGRMLTVALPEAALCNDLAAPGAPSLAAVLPGGCTVAGRPDAVAALADRLRARGVACVPVPATRAFHSALMDPILDELRAAVRAVPSRPPSLPWISNVTGDWITPPQVGDAEHGAEDGPEYWIAQLRHPVQLDRGFARLLDGGAYLLVQAGPGGSMVQLARRHAAWTPEHLALATLSTAADREEAELLSAVGQLWERGVDVAWPALAEPGALRVALPATPLERRRFWRDPAPPPRAPAAGVPLVRRAWIEAPLGRTVAPEAACVVVAERAPPISPATQHGAGAPCAQGSFGEEPARWLTTALSSRASLGADAWPEPITPAALAERMRGGDPPSTVVFVLPDAPDAPALDALERCAAAVTGPSELLIIGRRFCDVLGDEPLVAGAAEVLACIDRIAQTTRVRAIDLGTGQGAGASPPDADGGVMLWAWRGRRWWAWSTEPVASAPRAGTAQFALVTWGRGDGERVASALAAHGLDVRLVLDAGTAAESSPLSRASAAEPIAPRLREVDFHAPVAALAERRTLHDALDALCAAIVADLVLRRARLAPGERIADAELVARVDPRGRLPRFVQFFVAVLCGDRILERVDGGLRVAADARADVAAARARLGPEAADVAGLLRLLDHCAGAYDGVFSGETEPLAVIYPDGSDRFLRACAADNRVELSNATACLDTLCRTARARCDRAAGRPLRILEIGAGHGELTWRLLDGWRGAADLDYVVTDISPLLVRLARAGAAERDLANLRCQVFDITADAAAQGVVGPFDAILAYNVMHVAPSIPRAVEQLRALLAPGGWLGAVEVTGARRWDHLVWGLAPGWWGFDDELRSDAIGLDAPTWRRVLVAAGFADVAITPTATGADHAAILAAAPDLARAPSPSTDDLAAASDLAPVHDSAAAALDGFAARWRASGCSELIFLPDLTAGGAAAAALRRLHEAIAPAPAWLVTEDPAPTAPRAAYLARRQLATATDPRWRHLEVGSLDASTLAELPAILGSSALPSALRLVARTASRAASTTTSGAPVASASDVATDTRAAPHGPSITVTIANTPAAAVASIWRHALGLTDAPPDAEFAALGGDSLTSVHLLARLRERFGVELRMADFLTAPTLAGLTRLVEDALASRVVRDRSPYVIPLQGRGARRPLFCVAPAAGSPLCYQDLAARLGADQPFYGLEAHGLHDGRPPLRRLDDMAAAHIEAIRTIQPRGPYLLGGWSFGTMLAHEMVRQLEQAGERVALLACLDAVVPFTRGRPCGAVPGFLAQTMWRQAKLLLELRVPRRFDELAYVAAWLGVRLTDDEARGAGRPLARTIRELRGAVAGAPRFAEVYNANLRAALRYVPQPIACATVVFKTGVDGNTRRRDEIAALVRPLVRGRVEVVPVAGNHMTMLDPRHVGSLASRLRAVLDLDV